MIGKRTFLRIFLAILLVWLSYPFGICSNPPAVQSPRGEKFPLRPDTAITGSQFAKQVLSADEPRREQAILTQLRAGNFPNFLRRLLPVSLSHTFENGKQMMATIFVTPDYLAIGSDQDFLTIPMNLYTAVEVAVQWGFILPTKKMVDAIVKQSLFRLSPKPLTPGSRMRSTEWYLDHNQKIKEQRAALSCPLDALISGHKKDVVLTNRLFRTFGRIAIYGWHRLSGIPIQPLSTVHGATYADYSHGIRLVDETALVDGTLCSIYSLLEDPRLASLLSDEGPIRGVRQLMTMRRP